jgi:uncharacterized membrane protein HdeD (DUF308 family)
MAGTAARKFGADDPADGVRGARFWTVAAGAGMVLLGSIAALDLMMATLVVALWLGFLMLAAAALQLAHAFAVRRWSSSLLWAAGGLLYLAAGISVFVDPAFAVMLITLFLAISLGLSGIVRFLLASGWAGSGKAWLRMSGLVSIAAAVVIGLGWPLNTLWVLGLILAVDLLVQGFTLAFAGLALPAR